MTEYSYKYTAKDDGYCKQMLPKNIGATVLEVYNISSFDEDEMRPDSWFFVADNDVFPAEFIKFLSMDKDLKELFLEIHGDLLTAEYWRSIKSAHENGEVLEVVPYYRPPARRGGTGRPLPVCGDNDPRTQ